MVYDKSRITCISRQENVPVEAQFRKFTAQIAFDPGKPETGKARIEIEDAPVRVLEVRDPGAFLEVRHGDPDIIPEFVQ